MRMKRRWHAREEMWWLKSESRNKPQHSQWHSYLCTEVALPCPSGIYLQDVAFILRSACDDFRERNTNCTQASQRRILGRIHTKQLATSNRRQKSLTGRAGITMWNVCNRTIGEFGGIQVAMSILIFSYICDLWNRAHAVDKCYLWLRCNERAVAQLLLFQLRFLPNLAWNTFIKFGFIFASLLYLTYRAENLCC
jgi:hypothetical protein